MQLSDKSDPLRVDMSAPTLGAVMLSVGMVPTEGPLPMPRHDDSPAALTFLPPIVLDREAPLLFDPRLFEQLQVVIEELRGLRQDLADRTWGAWWRRCVVTVTTWFARRREQ